MSYFLKKEREEKIKKLFRAGIEIDYLQSTTYEYFPFLRFTRNITLYMNNAYLRPLRVEQMYYHCTNRTCFESVKTRLEKQGGCE